jgi:low affinity Fe/Cu permease
MATNPSWSFRRFSQWTANLMGHPMAFILATFACVVWAVSGPVFDYSDTWQLVINTATTVLTFLAVFLIQNTQNRDATAIHLKLDELILAVEGARTGLVELQELPDSAIEELRQEFHQLHEEHVEVRERIAEEHGP